MKALIYYGPHDIRLEEIEKPVCKDNDVIVKVMRAGICGSDLKAYLHDGHSVGILPKGEMGFDGQFGHEMVGVVNQVGKYVKNVKEGDRVFVNPMLCRKDGMMLCDMAGAFSEYVLVEEPAYGYNLMKLSDNTSFDDAVLTEPLAVATHGKNIAEIKPHENVVIYGAGTIGLCALEAVLAIGCKSPVIVDINVERLKLAEKIGGSAFNPSVDGEISTFLIDHFGSYMSPFGTKTVDVDAYIDCAGAESIIAEILRISKPKARISIVAVYKKPIVLDINPFQRNELTIHGCLGYETTDVVEAYNNIDQNRIQIGEIITHQFGINDGVKAFETAANPSTGAIKVVINYEM